jgi:hypothetical protein
MNLLRVHINQWWREWRGRLAFLPKLTMMPPARKIFRRKAPGAKQ